VHTVLVGLRARLRASADPDRIFRGTTELARKVGLVGVRRVLDSAPLFDAVATQDTVTLLRGAIRGLLRVCPVELASLVRAALERDDDYAAAGKPVCDWDDPAAREQLVDALFRDGYRALGVLRGRQLGPEVASAAALLATVIGQDIEETDDGRFVIAQGVAPDRVMSVVDPQARHGHKSNARGFDGYKGHVAIDPDSEVICAAEVGAANAGDAAMARALLADLPSASAPPAADPVDAAPAVQAAAGTTKLAPIVYGDAAYGTGALLADLEQRGITAMTKVAAPTAPHSHFTKQKFHIDLDQGTVTCPASLKVPIIPARQGGGMARFGRACQVCPLQGACTTSPAGRTITIHPQEARLAAARSRQQDPAWRVDYRTTGPRWNASSPICSVDGTAAAALGCEAGCGSPRTGGYWPPRSTWPASPCLACAQDRAGGRSPWHRRQPRSSRAQVGHRRRSGSSCGAPAGGRGSPAGDGSATR
jgi:Transposase DDE domain